MTDQTPELSSYDIKYILAVLATRCHHISAEHGFWDQGQGHPAIKIALMHSELSEALEVLRAPEGTDEQLVEELADCVIRILDFCGHDDLNLGAAILRKMAKNENRPHRHNKRF